MMNTANCAGQHHSIILTIPEQILDHDIQTIRNKILRIEGPIAV